MKIEMWVWNLIWKLIWKLILNETKYDGVEAIFENDLHHENDGASCKGKSIKLLELEVEEEVYIVV